MQYAYAKAIGLMWNWFIGRGVQAILAIICYRVYSDILMRAADCSPLPYELFTSLAFCSTKIDALWQLLKSLGLRGGWRVKAGCGWISIRNMAVSEECI
jgi:hypothetical protein